MKRQKLCNPNVFVSDKRLCVRNLPVSVDNKQLRRIFLKASGSKAAKITEVQQTARIFYEIKVFEAVVDCDLTEHASSYFSLAAIILISVPYYARHDAGQFQGRGQVPWLCFCCFL